MIITCPCGDKKFNVDASLIPQEGRTLQCGFCERKWFFKTEKGSYGEHDLFIGVNMPDIRKIANEYKLVKTDVNYFRSLLKGTITNHKELDARIINLLDRPIEELDTIERAILHIGCYELEHHNDIPWKSVINESVELAKIFGAEDSYKYINGILDKVAKELRQNKTKDLAS